MKLFNLCFRPLTLSHGVSNEVVFIIHVFHCHHTEISLCARVSPQAEADRFVVLKYDEKLIPTPVSHGGNFQQRCLMHCKKICHLGHMFLCFSMEVTVIMYTRFILLTVFTDVGSGRVHKSVHS